MKALIAVFAMITLTLVGCAKPEGEKQADNANAKMQRNNDIKMNLWHRGIKIASDSDLGFFSKQQIRDMKDSELKEVKGLLEEFMANAGEVLRISESGKVVWKEGNRENIENDIKYANQRLDEVKKEMAEREPKVNEPKPQIEKTPQPVPQPKPKSKSKKQG